MLVGLVRWKLVKVATSFPWWTRVAGSFFFKAVSHEVSGQILRSLCLGGCLDVIPQRFWGFSACIWHILQAGSALKAMKEVHWKFFWLACDRNRIHKMQRFFAMNFWRIFCWNGILISSAAWFFQRTSRFNFRLSRVVQISKRLNQLQASQSLGVLSPKTNGC